MIDYGVYRLTTKESLFLIVQKPTKELELEQYFLLHKDNTDRLNIVTEASRDSTKRIVSFDKPFFNNKTGTKIVIPNTIEYNKNDFPKDVIIAEYITGPFREYVTDHFQRTMAYKQKSKIEEPQTPMNTPVTSPNNSEPNSPTNSVRRRFFGMFS